MKKGEITKRNIADAFRNLLRSNEFDEITITDITNECDLNRLTFYYHFKDKYDLLYWIFDIDVIQPVIGTIDPVNWSDRLLCVLKEIRDKKEYYDKIITYKRMDFWNYMFEVSKTIIMDTLEAVETSDIDCLKDNFEFTSYFVAFGVSGSIYDWAANGMKETPEEMVAKIERVVDYFRDKAERDKK